MTLLSYAGLIKKMIQYVQPDVLSALCSSEGLQSHEQSLGTLLVEVIASVLDNEVQHEPPARSLSRQLSRGLVTSSRPSHTPSHFLTPPNVYYISINWLVLWSRPETFMRNSELR